VFALSSDNAVYHMWFDGTSWIRWNSLGGSATSDPAATSWGTGHIGLFARGQDQAIYDRLLSAG
jgi:hypothetical protein